MLSAEPTEHQSLQTRAGARKSPGVQEVKDVVEHLRRRVLVLLHWFFVYCTWQNDSGKFAEIQFAFKLEYLCMYVNMVWRQRRFECIAWPNTLQKCRTFPSPVKSPATHRIQGEQTRSKR